MTQCNLFLLYIHTHLTDSIDLKYIAEQLIKVNSRRSRINYLNFDTDNFIPNLLRINLRECRVPKFSPGPPDL